VSAGALLALSMLLAWPLHAQLSTASMASGSFNGTAASCPSGSVFAVGVTASCAAAGPVAPGSISAEARADAGGRLRGTATARGAGLAGPTVATATASWTERLEFRPLTRDVLVRFTFEFNGIEVSSGGGTLPSGRPDALALTFMRLGVTRDSVTRGPQYDELLVRRTYENFGTRRDSSTQFQFTRQNIEGPFSSTPGYVPPPAFDVFLFAGNTQADFTWNFALNAIIEGGGFGTISGFYSNTAAITSIALLDKDTGEDVSREFDLRTASGAVYTVPEPSSFALLMVAAAVLGGAARRRRQG
jgi:hypothetical protein